MGQIDHLAGGNKGLNQSRADGEENGVESGSLPVSSFSLLLASRSFPCWPLASSLPFFTQRVPYDFTKGLRATDGRLLLRLPRGELGSVGEDMGLRAAFHCTPCGWAFWASSLAVMADQLEWGGGVRKGPVQYAGLTWNLHESSTLAP